jgi:ABC-2 type transport system ATP-binding protein
MAVVGRANAAYGDGVGSAIVIRGLVKRFGSAVALDGLDLEVPTGEAFGFVGPNGAGKTTTIRVLLDLIRPTAGTVSVLGLDPRRDGVALRHRVGYLPGALELPPRLSGRSFLADGAALRGRRMDDEVAALAERLDADLDRPMGELSLGNRRKIGMIAAFAPRPELLVLDEPTGGLDPLVQQTFRALAREAVADGRTVFLSSHVLDEVQHVTDSVGVLRAGRLVAGGRIDTLIAQLVRTFRIRFDDADAPPPDPARLLGVPGVVAARPCADGLELKLDVEVPAGPLLAALAPLRPSDLHCSEADLEDLFLGYYGERGRS